MSAVPQLPLRLGMRAQQSFANFSGEAGTLLAAAVALRPRGAWLVTGPAGSGKSHLLRAAVHAAGEDGQYLTLATHTGDESAAMLALAAPGMRRVIALDDADALITHSAGALALFDLYNAQHDAGGMLLVSLRHVPEHLPTALPDLQSRLQQATRLPLPALNDDERLQILKAQAQRRGLVLEDAAGHWLLRHHARDMHALTAALARLDAASLAARRRLTIPFLRQVLDL